MALAEEVALAQPPDTVGWSENFCFVGYDVERSIAVWIHLGTWPRDRRLWREQIHVFLPDGTVLTQRHHGLRPTPGTAMSGGNLEIAVEDPGRRIGLRYRGPARPTTIEELARLPLAQKAPEPLDVELVFEATAPVWDFGSAMVSQPWASFHHEQPARLHGTVRSGMTETVFDGPAYRDHSRGVRDLTSLAGSCWIQGHFPSGRSFALTHTRTRDGNEVQERLTQARVFDDGRSYPAVVHGAPYLGSPVDPPSDAYTLRIESELGDMHVEADIWKQLPATTDLRFNCYDGINPELGIRGMYEAPTRYRWNGQDGAGWTERSSSFATPR